MEFRILGPLEVLHDGAVVEISAPRLRALLAVLVIEAGHVVPMARLVETVWDDAPPATARSQVQICISGLRKIMSQASGRELIITRAAGYQLDTSDDPIDVVEFERLTVRGRRAVGDGRLADAIADLRAALALWRGPALASIDSRIVQIAATRLNEQRLAVLEKCIATELALGGHAEMTGELAALVAENPLREKLRVYHMLALYRSGRRADALEAYREAHQTMVCEIGVEPGAELRDLHQAILKNDPGLTVPSQLNNIPKLTQAQHPAPVPRQLPADIADFTGRQDIIGRLCSLLSQARGPEGSDLPMQVAVLTGMSGVGKTALAVHVAHVIEDSFPDGQLFVQLRGGDSLPASADEMLQRCLRAFGVAGSAMPGTPAERAETYRTLLASRRVLVVLDDVASMSQAMPLLPGNRNCAVIVTTRQRRLPGLLGGHMVEVEVLSPDAAVGLLRQVLGSARTHAADADVEELAALCGFLPLALRLVAAKLLERPHWTVRQMVSRLADEKNRLAELEIGDTSVTASISIAYESLTPEAGLLFTRLGLLGSTDFAPWVGAPLLDADMEHVRNGLDQLVACRLLEVRRLSDGQVRFYLHELVRAFAVVHLGMKQSTRERGDALRRLLGCWLFLVTQAHRRVYGGDFVTLHGSAEHWRLPDQFVAELLGNALDWLRNEHQALILAIEKAARAGLDEYCWDLATTAVTLFEADSLFGDWRRTHEIALEAVRCAGNERGEAAILCSLGELAYADKTGKDARAELLRAWEIFDAAGDLHGRALAGRHLAFVEDLRGHRDLALARYQEVLHDLRSVGDLAAEAHALSGMAAVHLERAEYAKAEQLLAEALTRCRELRLRRVETQVLHRLAEVYLGQGHFEPAAQVLRSVLSEVRASGDRVGAAYALHGLGLTFASSHRNDEAVAYLSEAIEIARELGNRIIEGRALLALGELYGRSGSGASALAVFAEALEVLRQTEAVAWQARVLSAIGGLHLGSGEDMLARKAWTEALNLLKGADPTQTSEITRCLERLGDSPDPGTAEVHLLRSALAGQPHGVPAVGLLAAAAGAASTELCVRAVPGIVIIPPSTSAGIVTTAARKLVMIAAVREFRVSIAVCLRRHNTAGTSRVTRRSHLLQVQPTDTSSPNTATDHASG
jgi:DNA-binding SARP family transcriptional activator/tetratricopeptide (TPR) repeat protein